MLDPLSGIPLFSCYCPLVGYDVLSVLVDRWSSQSNHEIGDLFLHEVLHNLYPLKIDGEEHWIPETRVVHSLFILQEVDLSGAAVAVLLIELPAFDFQLQDTSTWVIVAIPQASNVTNIILLKKCLHTSYIVFLYAIN